MLMLSLKTRNQIISDLRTALKNYDTVDTSERKWSDTELEYALNMTLLLWGGSVSIPATYDVTAAKSVELPWYIPSVEQVLRKSDGVPLTTSREMYRWDHILFTPPSTSEDCTIVFPLVNRECSIINASIEVNTEFNTSQNTLILTTSSEFVPETGVLQVDDIWLVFVRDAIGANTVAVKILKVLTRGRTLPSTIAAAEAVEIGVFVPDPVLWLHLQSFASAVLHSMLHAHGSTSDIENETWFMRWNDAQAETAMKKFQPRVPQQRIFKK